jgi:SSS family solute:Na+ symporter/sodium/proline symporter
MRYGPGARILGTITIVIAYTTIAAYQFRGGGRLLSLIADIDPGTGALITAAFCIAYTAIAGMLSVAYLDVGNGIMMTIGCGVAVAYLVYAGGGPAVSLDALRPDQVAVFGTLDPVRDALALFLPTLFLLMGEANMYQKFFSARDERAARTAVVGWIVGTILVETLIVAIGAFGSVSIPGLSTGESEAIVVRVAVDVLPATLGILLLAGAAAIIVSTANSFLLTPASNLMRDVYQRFINPNATDRQVLLYTRALVLVLGAAGFIALKFFTTILQMALWAYTMYGAVITPVLLAAFVWPRVTRQGGIAAMAVGMATTLGWEIIAKMRSLDGTPLYPFGYQTIYPALILSIGTLVVVSLSTPAPDETELAGLR